jgi:endonuclease-3
MKKSDIIEVMEIFKKDNPKPQSDLIYTNPYTLLTAVLLSAQTTDIGVNKATKELFKIADTPQKMLDLGEERLKNYIKTIGLYNNKAKNVIKMSKILVDKYDGEVPNKREALEALPGVGRKTANVVLNIAFGMKTIAVDTHVFRVANRLKLVESESLLEVEQGLEKKIPDDYLYHAHHWLILHGRYICKARTPLCSKCPIVQYCSSKDKTI